MSQGLGGQMCAIRSISWQCVAWHSAFAILAFVAFGILSSSPTQAATPHAQVNEDTVCWEPKEQCLTMAEAGEHACQSLNLHYVGPSTMFDGYHNHIRVFCDDKDKSERSIYAYCPKPELYNLYGIKGTLNVLCVPYRRDELKDLGDCGTSQGICKMRGNPIEVTRGNKFQREVDYEGHGAFPLKFHRHYNSLPYGVDAHIGNKWRHTYDRSVTLETTDQTTHAVAKREDGKILYFAQSGSAWIPSTDVVEKLEQIAGGGWKITDSKDDVETYNAAGKLVSVVNRAGLGITLTYSDANTPPTTAPVPGLLIRVEDTFGRQLNLSYNSFPRVVQVSVPGGGIYQYAYDSNGNLQQVTYPDLAIRSYQYNEQARMSGVNNPRALTGITDENGKQFSRFSYDANGKAMRSERVAAGVDGLGKITVAYVGSSGPSSITDAFNVTRQYSWTEVNGSSRILSISGDACPSCGPKAATYSSAGFLSSSTDWNDKKTCYNPNARGLEDWRIEGLPSSTTCSPTLAPSGTEQRKISTAWHTPFRLPTKMAEPLRLTTYVYNGDLDGGNVVTCGPTPNQALPPGVLCLKRVQATTDANGTSGTGVSPDLSKPAREWRYKYNAEGQVTEVDGPLRTGANLDLPVGQEDKTTYAYHANTANSCPTPTLPGSHINGCRGQISSITNAVGHTTHITEYNAHGQPVKMTDPNSLVTTFEYDARQRMTKRTLSGGATSPEETQYEYLANGLLKKVTNPDLSYVQYTYDDAQRLTQVEDNLQNRIVYGLDAMGNRVSEKTYLAGNYVNEVQLLEREYNALNQLLKIKGGTNPLAQITQYEYDGNGNIKKMTMPFATASHNATNRTYDYTYDALNRMTSVMEPPSAPNQPRGTIVYEYDLLDQLKTVKDPRSTTAKPINTIYTIDGLGNTISINSPDAGIVSNTEFDAAGNVRKRRDAKTQDAVYQFDALNRVTQITYDPGTVIHTFTYDQAAGGASKGRLTKITDPTGTIEYRYDLKGRVIAELRTPAIAGATTTYVTSYAYDTHGRLQHITYPSGRQVTNFRDSLGRIAKIETTKAGAQLVLVDSVTYRPFGPIATYTLGGSGGKVVTRAFDKDGRITSYTVPGAQTATLGFDAASRVISLSEPNVSRAFEYDNLDRITKSTIGASDIRTFEYDISGNRTKLVVGNESIYNYEINSNRLQQITGAINKSFAYDPNGSVCRMNGGACDPSPPFVYDVRGRLSQVVTGSGTFTYGVNALGQRVRKSGGTGGSALDRIYHYDMSGRLIAESSPNGTITQEYFYLEDIPIAVMRVGM